MMGAVKGHYVVFSDGTEKNVLAYFQENGFPIIGCDGTVTRSRRSERERKYNVTIIVEESKEVLRDKNGFPIGEMA